MLRLRWSLVVVWLWALLSMAQWPTTAPSSEVLSAKEATKLELDANSRLVEANNLISSGKVLDSLAGFSMYANISNDLAHCQTTKCRSLRWDSSFKAGSTAVSLLDHLSSLSELDFDEAKKAGLMRVAIVSFSTAFSIALRHFDYGKLSVTIRSLCPVLARDPAVSESSLQLFQTVGLDIEELCTKLQQTFDEAKAYLKDFNKNSKAALSPALENHLHSELVDFARTHDFEAAINGHPLRVLEAKPVTAEAADLGVLFSTVKHEIATAQQKGQAARVVALMVSAAKHVVDFFVTAGWGQLGVSLQFQIPDDRLSQYFFQFNQLLGLRNWFSPSKFHLSNLIYFKIFCEIYRGSLKFYL